jgi:hypothetical protein
VFQGKAQERQYCAWARGFSGIGAVAAGKRFYPPLGLAAMVLRMRVAMVAGCVFVLVLALPAVLASGNGDHVGVSGECYSAGGDGGKAHVAVKQDGSVEQDGIVDTDDPTNIEGGAVHALATAGAGAPGYLTQGEQLCTAPETEERGDYIEVHALGFQVCYNGSFHFSQDRDAWVCETRPHGL